MVITDGKIHIFHYKNLEPRQALWMSAKLPNIKIGDGGPYTHEDITKAIDKFAFKSDENRFTLEKLRSETHKNLISKDYFEWIQEGDNTRLLRWLRWRYAPLYMGYMGNPSYPQLDPNCSVSTIYNNFICSFDLWDVPSNVKIDEINSLRRAWAQHILFDKKYKWLDPKDGEQVLWAWQNIQLGMHTKFKNQGIHRYDPLNTKEYYESVISVFDCWIGHPAELKITLDEMKKAWAQQKYRKGLEGKKQYTFVLNENTKKKLDHMATLKDRRLNEVLEQLINAEYRQMFPDKAQSR